MPYNPCGQSRGGKEVAQGHAVHQHACTSAALQESSGKAALEWHNPGSWERADSEGAYDASAAAARSNKGMSIIAVWAVQGHALPCSLASTTGMSMRMSDAVGYST